MIWEIAFFPSTCGAVGAIIIGAQMGPSKWILYYLTHKKVNGVRNMRQGEETVTARLLKRFRSFRYILVIEGIGVGIAAGLVAVLFRIALEGAETARQYVGNFISLHPWALLIWMLVLAGLAALVNMLLKWDAYISGSGIPQVEGELHGALCQKWWRVLLAKLTGGVLAIGAGLSLGREGPSIQMGAMAGKGVSKLTRRGRTEEKMLMTCGASAGLAAAFNAPFAGVLFSLEELHKNFSVDVLLSSMSASITADFISRYVFGLKPVFDFSAAQMMPLSSYWTVLVLGVLLGLAGALYNFCVRKSQDLYGKIKTKYLRLLIPFMIAGILLVVYPAVLGGGHNLVELVSQAQPLDFLILLFLMKFLFSMLSFGSGAPGGIFLPMLVLGAAAGSIFSGLMNSCGLDAHLQNFVILGMAGLFSAIVRAPVTGIILISEMTGSFSHLLTLSLVSLTAYAVADLMHSRPVYDMLLSRLIRKDKPVQTGEKLLIESPVCYGSAACSKKVRELSWPGNALIVSVKRRENEIVPHGDTLLQAGDVIVLLCDEGQSREVYAALEAQCKSSS